MKNVLSRGYVAEDVNGNETVIRNIVEYIKKVGIARFLADFGFDFGKVSYETQYIPLIKDELVHTQRYWSEKLYSTRKVAKYEYQYRIKDGFGRYYSPSYLASEFRRVYPDAANACEGKSDFRWRSRNWGTQRMRQPKLRAEYRRPRWQRRLWETSIDSQEQGIKPVRNIKNYQHFMWDDDLFRKNERNWKRYRKTQYNAV